MNRTIHNHNARIWGLVLLLGMLPFLILAAVGAILSPQYEDTYYGELPDLYENLEQTDGQKIVVIGNSGTTFGIDSDLAEQLLSEAGLPYSVCKFGLYGSLGTRCMMELARDSVQEGDLVILSPELFPQSLSMYFSAKEVWYAIEQKPELLFQFSPELRTQMIHAYLPFARTKLRQYLTGETAKGSGIYAHSSFDSKGNIRNYEHSANEMPGGTDRNAWISLDAEVISSDFAEYLREYRENLRKKGAEVYYAFSPMNREAVIDSSEETQEQFYQEISEFLRIPILGELSGALMDPEWFYDSNFHLNESGSVLYTVQLVNAVKNQLGNTTRTEIRYPAKPVIADRILEGEGNNQDQDQFLYRLEEGSAVIIGLSESGKQAEELVIPTRVEGYSVTAIEADALLGDTSLRRITVPMSLRSLPNGCFSGCTSLEKLLLLHDSPSDISVGYELLKGAPGSVKIVVSGEKVSEFANNYFWSRYAENICAEEEWS